jgi:thioredoxin reductase (NADPH)
VFVVGGGNSAAQAVLHFARYAAKVAMVVREESLHENLSHYLVGRIVRAAPQIGVLLNTGDCHRGRRIAAEDYP